MFKGLGAIATMHGKEHAIGPVLLHGLGLQLTVADDVDTDLLGTFTGEISRAGSARDTALTKARLALRQIPQARYGVGSEGSFGPHPLMPFLTAGCETIVLLSRDEDVMIDGHDLTTQTNCIEQIVTTVDQAIVVAKRLGFPSHRAVVTGVRNGRSCANLGMTKGIDAEELLRRAVAQVLTHCGSACIQSDMRAHFNPTRMRAIERATYELVRRANSRCPDCSFPGYDVVERIAGLPCVVCGEPSDATQHVVLACAQCSRREVLPRPDGRRFIDAGGCATCNP